MKMKIICIILVLIALPSGCVSRKSTQKLSDKSRLDIERKLDSISQLLTVVTETINFQQNKETDIVQNSTIFELFPLDSLGKQAVRQITIISTSKKEKKQIGSEAKKESKTDLKSEFHTQESDKSKLDIQTKETTETQKNCGLYIFIPIILILIFLGYKWMFTKR